MIDTGLDPADRASFVRVQWKVRDTLNRLNKRGLLVSDGAGHGVLWRIADQGGLTKNFLPPAMPLPISRPRRRRRMAQCQATTCMKLGSGGVAAHVFAPRHFAGILAEMRPGDMVMLTNLRASQPQDIAFCLVRAGAIFAVGFPMIDPLHFKGRMKIVPSSRLVGMDNAASGDATTNDRDDLGLMFHDCRLRSAAPLAHHHAAAPLAALVLASTPIDADRVDVFLAGRGRQTTRHRSQRPRAQTGRREVRRQSASQLCGKTNAVFAYSPR